MIPCKYEIIKFKNQTLLLNLDELGLGLINTTDNDNLMDLMRRPQDINHEEYFAISKQFYNKQKINKKLSQISIIVTYECNFACQYCYQQHLNQRNTKEAITHECIDAIFNYCRDKEKTDNFSIHLSGGEPLLLKNEKIIAYILEKIRQEGYKVLITTNGYTLIDYIPLLTKYMSIIKQINLSIDGPDPIHAQRRKLKFNVSSETYSVNRIIDGVKNLVGRIKFSVNTLLDSQNIKYLPEIMEFFKVTLLESNLISRVRIAPVTQLRTNYQNVIENTFFEEIVDFFKIINSWDENLATRVEIVSAGCSKIDKMVNAIVSESDEIVYPGYGCSPVNQLSFDQYGDIYLCELFLGENEMKLGTYYPEFKLTGHYQNFQNRSPFTIEKCKNCKYVFICGSGCGYLAFIHNDNPLLYDCTGFEGRYKNGLFHIYLPQMLKIKKVLTEDDIVVEEDV